MPNLQPSKLLLHWQHSRSLTVSLETFHRISPPPKKLLSHGLQDSAFFWFSCYLLQCSFIITYNSVSLLPLTLVVPQWSVLKPPHFSIYTSSVIWKPPIASTIISTLMTHKAISLQTLPFLAPLTLLIYNWLGSIDVTPLPQTKSFLNWALNSPQLPSPPMPSCLTFSSR